MKSVSTSARTTDVIAETLLRKVVGTWTQEEIIIVCDVMGWSQGELAKALGCSDSCLAQIQAIEHVEQVVELALRYRLLEAWGGAFLDAIPLHHRPLDEQ